MAERRVLELARHRHGIVALAQLNAAGLSDDAVRRRVEKGWLVRVHPAVYCVGEPTDLGRTQAALIAGGPAAMAAAGSAAALEGLLPHPDQPVIVVPRGGARPRGVRTIQPREAPRWVLKHGMRCTMVPETLLALAARSYGDALDATDRAFVQRKTSTDQLTAFLAGRRGHRGSAVLTDLVEGPRTRSALERRFLALLRAARLPLPLANVPVDGHLVGFFWPGHRLVVETDGWASHGRRRQWERGHARDLDHFGAGTTSLRVTSLQLTRQPHAVTARLGARLLGGG